MYFLLSRTHAGPGRTVKQEQKEITRNHVQAFIPGSVHGLGCVTHALAAGILHPQERNAATAAIASQERSSKNLNIQRITPNSTGMIIKVNKMNPRLRELT